jgi:uncharacterized membrane protein YfcA
LSSLRVPEYTTDAEVRQRHRRAVTWRIVAPVAAAGLAIIAVGAGLALALSSAQLNSVASCMSLLILVPAVLVCVVPYALIVAMFAGTRRLYFWLPSKLTTARSAAHRVNIVAHRLSMGVARPIISINQRVTWLEHVTARKLHKSYPLLPRERR